MQTNADIDESKVSPYPAQSYLGICGHALLRYRVIPITCGVADVDLVTTTNCDIASAAADRLKQAFSGGFHRCKTTYQIPTGANFTTDV